MYIWEFYNGEIPEGYDIHHKVSKRDNEIEHLEMLTKSEHRKVHYDIFSEDRKKQMKLNLEKNARPKAIEWHKSEEGKAWHKNQYERTLAKVKEKEFICENCGEKFKSKPKAKNKFCSNKCKSSWRRKEGLDNEIRICEYCKKEFTINKYSKTRTCSKACSNRLIPRLPQLKNKLSKD